MFLIRRDVYWIWFLSLLFWLSHSSRQGGHGREKRIIGGLDLLNHHIYRTESFIQMKTTFGCLTYGYDHQLNDCDQLHWCTGTLVHPQFVMTACHCISYPIFYSSNYTPSKNTPTPYIPRDPWSLHAERVRSWSNPFHRGFELVKMRMKGYHPLYNTMALFAGSADTKDMKQRRHAAGFFPHTLCTKKTEEMYLGDPRNPIYPIEYDVGLIKTCFPFKLTTDIEVANIHPVYNLWPTLLRALSTNQVCLIAGYGVYNPTGEIYDTGARTLPKFLQHGWRYIDCSRECTFGIHCLICSTHHTNFSFPTRGDSGSPLICNGKMIAIHSSGGADYDSNITYSMEFPIACTEEYIKTYYLERLAKLKDKIFHWLDGSPVTFKPRRRFRKRSAFYTVSPAPQLLPSCAFVIFAFLPSHYLF